MKVMRTTLLAGCIVVLAGIILLSCHQPIEQAVAATNPAFEKPGQAAFRLAQVGKVTTYRPDGPVRGVAIFLSGDGGWNLGVVDMAKALRAKGVVVAGISTPAFLKGLSASKDQCIDPNFALVALAQDVEHRLALPHYIKPILVGYSSGATVAYAALARSPAGIYKAAVSLGFGPDLPGKKPWCAIGSLVPKPISKPEKGWLFPAVNHLPAAWIILQGLDDEVVVPEVTKAFALKVSSANLIELPKVGHGFSVEANWMPQFSKAFDPLLEQESRTSDGSGVSSPDGGNVAVADLPLTPVVNPEAPATETMAVLYSGDGGWAGLDRDMASALAAKGIPVVGFDSLDYFWTAKSPSQSATDLKRIIDHYGSVWHRPRILLIGYSYGANVLPFIVGNLPAATRAKIDRVSLLGLDSKADFQFHLSSWLDISGQNALPTVPQVQSLKLIHFQCIRGREESGSACPAISSPSVQQQVLPGGHHFEGNTELLVKTMTGQLKL